MPSAHEADACSAEVRKVLNQKDSLLMNFNGLLFMFSQLSMYTLRTVIQ